MVSLLTIVVAAHVLGKITSLLQRDDIEEKVLRIYDGLQLADTSFNTSSPVDILLGNENIWSVLSGGRKYDIDGNIVTINFIFVPHIPETQTANTSLNCLANTAAKSLKTACVVLSHASML